MSPFVLPNPSARRRRRNTWIAIAVLFTLVCPPIALWVLLIEGEMHAGRPLVVRAPVPTDFAPSVNAFEWTDPAARPIAIAEGTVTRTTHIEAALYVVGDGISTKNNRASTFRGTERGSPRWRRKRITFALAETETSEGRFAWIAVRGMSGGGASGFLTPHRFEAKFQQVFTGDLNVGKPRLLYAEGDRKFVARPDMTVEEFAKTNDGNFLVVTVTRQ